MSNGIIDLLQDDIKTGNSNPVRQILLFVAKATLYYLDFVKKLEGHNLNCLVTDHVLEVKNASSTETLTRVDEHFQTNPQFRPYRQYVQKILKNDRTKTQVLEELQLKQEPYITAFIDDLLNLSTNKSYLSTLVKAITKDPGFTIIMQPELSSVKDITTFYNYIDALRKTKEGNESFETKDFIENLRLDAVRNRRATNLSPGEISPYDFYIIITAKNIKIAFVYGKANQVFISIDNAGWNDAGPIKFTDKNFIERLSKLLGSEYTTTISSRYNYKQ